MYLHMGYTKITCNDKSVDDRSHRQQVVIAVVRASMTASTTVLAKDCNILVRFLKRELFSCVSEKEHTKYFTPIEAEKIGAGVSPILMKTFTQNQ